MNEDKQQYGFNGVYNRLIKHILDFFLALFLGIILTPFYIITAIAVALEDGFPVFYRPQRGGYQDRPFRIIKFRTMVKNADSIGGGTTALNDPRITRVGNVLRKTKLDETPQLFNILNGTMSFIGPRPELIQYTSQYEGEEELIFEVRPGITDFSSLEFINLDEIVGSGDADKVYESYILARKNQLRIKYAKEVSFKTDLKLFFDTVIRVLQKVLKLVRDKE